MIVPVNGNALEIQDTGAPRGERNQWYVSLNGVLLHYGGSRRKAEELFETMKQALESTKRTGWEP